MGPTTERLDERREGGAAVGPATWHPNKCLRKNMIIMQRKWRDIFCAGGVWFATAGVVVASGRPLAVWACLRVAPAFNTNVWNGLGMQETVGN